MPKINQKEYGILKNIDDKWVWIARDEFEGMFLFVEKPYKHGYFPKWRNKTCDWKVFKTEGFQFIQWEDVEPHNIAELIEEYEFENVLSDKEKFEEWYHETESEETEVKKLKSVITEFSQESQVVNSWEGSFTGGYLSSIGFAEVEISSESPLDRGKYLGKEVTIIVGDDEPEVLSQEWISEKSIDTHVDTVNGEIQVTFILDDLQNLLVPKQELPVIPHHVAKWISVHHEQFDLYPALKRLENNALSWEGVYDWYRKNTRKFVNAYLTGKYEVEEKQKYYVCLGDGQYLVSEDELKEHYAKIRHEEDIGFSNYVLTFTEQEIKDYDERFWPFAVKVEEME